MCSVRGNRISMIFQEPMTSLNPVFTVGDQIAEAVLVHQKTSREQAQEARGRDARAGRHPAAGDRATAPTRTRCPAACASGS